MCQRGGRAAPHLLVQLGELARHRGLPLAEHGRHVGEAFSQPGRRLEEHQRSRHTLKLGKPRPARALLGRQESREQERIGRQPGAAKRRQQRAGARQARHAMVFVQTIAHQLVAGIGYERRAGVADQRYRLAARQLGQDARALALGVVLVIGAQRSRDGIVRQQRTAVAGILAVDHIGPRQGGQRAQGDVGEVADRRRHQIEPRRQSLRQLGFDHLGSAPRRQPARAFAVLRIHIALVRLSPHSRSTPRMGIAVEN